MNRRRIGPLVAVVLLVALGAYVYLVEIRGHGGEAPAGPAGDRAVPLDRASVKAIRITNTHGTLRLEKQGDGWKLTEPLASDADKDAVEGLLSSIESARVERRLKAGEERKPYGLDPPPVTLTVEGAAAPVTLGIGEASPIGGTWYALTGAGEVVVVGSTLGDLGQKDAFALRDKALLALDPWKIRRLTLERGRETLKFEKPDEGWIVRQPVEAPADGPTLTDFLNALENLRATRFDAESPSAGDLNRYGLTPPQAKLTLFQDGWDVEKTVLFGKEAEGGGRYARTLGRDPVITVPADFWTKVTTRFFDLRRRDLMSVQTFRVESFSVARPGRPAVTLKRTGEQEWAASGGAAGTVAGTSIDVLLRMISDFKALAFDDHPKESVRVGISRRPALDLILEEEADTGTGKKRSQHLLVSPPDRRNQVLVRDMAWTPIAVAAGDVLKKVQTQIDAVLKEAATPKPSPSPSPEPSAGPAPSATPAASPAP